jgi:hypothetical protein
VKKLVALLLLSTFFLQQFYVAGVAIWFYANRTYIARQLCINKDNPELNCKGTCVLTKKLKQAEQKQEQQLPLQQRQIKESAPVIIEQIQICFNTPQFVSSLHAIYITDYSYQHSNSIFHPPSILS